MDFSKHKEILMKTIVSNLSVYAVMHAIIDLISIAVLFSVLKNQIGSVAELINLVILYNVIAFGLQAIIGYATDYFKSPRAILLSGCFLTAVSAIGFSSFPVAAVVLAGLGNALFHVGAGSICLNLTPKKASAPGIFVATGAVGVLAGTVLGKSGQFIAWPLILTLIILCFFVLVIKKPDMNYKKEEILNNKVNYFQIILILILLSIAIRSLVGVAIVFPWKTDMGLLIALTLAVVLGKGLGGLLADKFGWLKVAVGALVLSIPFLVFGANLPFIAIVGMFLFNITMPVTLVAISNILPGRPGFAFGLTCLALVLGSLPIYIYYGVSQFLSSELSILIIILISSVALFYGLRTYFMKYLKKTA